MLVMHCKITCVLIHDKVLLFSSLWEWKSPDGRSTDCTWDQVECSEFQ